MRFPTEDQYWMQVRFFLECHAKPLDPILAPNEFLEFFPGNYHYNISYFLKTEHFSFVIIHKGMLGEIDTSLILKVVQCFHPVFANEVFVVYAKTLIFNLSPFETVHLQSLLEQIKQPLDISNPPQNSSAIVITTYNRSQCLARSLPQILETKVPIVVVDDASSPEQKRENQHITDKYQVPLLQLPTNRGLPTAINTGISYWLADPEIDWISYFQDDVDVMPDILEILAKIQDPKARPLLTGRDAPEHLTFKTMMIGDYQVLLKRSMPGVHLHAHRHYWESVMPIPTPYLGAPKPDRGKLGQGADEDWWITAWSPQSIVKQGGYVVCVPDLVRTFDDKGQNSTWHKSFS